MKFSNSYHERRRQTTRGIILTESVPCFTHQTLTLRNQDRDILLITNSSYLNLPPPPPPPPPCCRLSICPVPPIESQFDKRVEQFRQMYSVDSSLPATDSCSAAQTACPTQILFLVLHGGQSLGRLSCSFSSDP